MTKLYINPDTDVMSALGQQGHDSHKSWARAGSGVVACRHNANAIAI